MGSGGFFRKGDAAWSWCGAEINNERFSPSTPLYAFSSNSDKFNFISVSMYVRVCVRARVRL